MPYPNLRDHLFGPGPKRILTCDGGGVRGILTLGYLARIEAILRERQGGDPGFRLCHYFDLIGGTSTGAIIAAGLAKGMLVAELLTLYRGLAKSIFPKQPWWQTWWKGLLDAKFATAPLAAALEKEFTDITLGDSRLQTGLMIVAKRFDTGSPWVMHNHPNGPFFDPPTASGIWPNKNYPLRQIIRASTAAPHYFEPERIPVDMGVGGKVVEGAFVDGGVSPHNNPALQAVMLATLKGHAWNWSLGEDKLLVVSAGTGFSVPRVSVDDAMGQPAAVMAIKSLTGLMTDASEMNKQIMQWLGRALNPWKIDAEVGDLAADNFGGQKWFTYLRYDVRLETKWLNEELNANVDDAQVKRFNEMDNAQNLGELEELGDRAAARQVHNAHFQQCFDLPPTTN